MNSEYYGVEILPTLIEKLHLGSEKNLDDNINSDLKIEKEEDDDTLSTSSDSSFYRQDDIFEKHSSDASELNALHKISFGLIEACPESHSFDLNDNDIPQEMSTQSDLVQNSRLFPPNMETVDTFLSHTKILLTSLFQNNTFSGLKICKTLNVYKFSVFRLSDKSHIFDLVVQKLQNPRKFLVGFVSHIQHNKIITKQHPLSNISTIESLILECFALVQGQYTASLQCVGYKKETIHFYKNHAKPHCDCILKFDLSNKEGEWMLLADKHWCNRKKLQLIGVRAEQLTQISTLFWKKLHIGHLQKFYDFVVAEIERFLTRSNLNFTHLKYFQALYQNTRFDICYKTRFQRAKNYSISLNPHENSDLMFRDPEMNKLIICQKHFAITRHVRENKVDFKLFEKSLSTTLTPTISYQVEFDLDSKEYTILKNIYSMREVGIVAFGFSSYLREYYICQKTCDDLYSVIITYCDSKMKKKGLKSKECSICFNDAEQGNCLVEIRSNVSQLYNSYCQIEIVERNEIPRILFCELEPRLNSSRGSELVSQSKSSQRFLFKRCSASLTQFYMCVFKRPYDYYHKSISKTEKFLCSVLVEMDNNQHITRVHILALCKSHNKTGTLSKKRRYRSLSLKFSPKTRGIFYPFVKTKDYLLESHRCELCRIVTRKTLPSGLALEKTLVIVFSPEGKVYTYTDTQLMSSMLRAFISTKLMTIKASSTHTSPYDKLTSNDQNKNMLTIQKSKLNAIEMPKNGLLAYKVCKSHDDYALLVTYYVPPSSMITGGPDKFRVSTVMVVDIEPLPGIEDESGKFSFDKTWRPRTPPMLKALHNYEKNGRDELIEAVQMCPKCTKGLFENDDTVMVRFNPCNHLTCIECCMLYTETSRLKRRVNHTTCPICDQRIESASYILDEEEKKRQLPFYPKFVYSKVDYPFTSAYSFLSSFAFEYQLGRIYHCDNYETNLTVQCGSGFHCFFTVSEGLFAFAKRLSPYRPPVPKKVNTSKQESTASSSNQATPFSLQISDATQRISAPIMVRTADEKVCEKTEHVISLDQVNVNQLDVLRQFTNTGEDRPVLYPKLSSDDSLEFWTSFTRTTPLQTDDLLAEYRLPESTCVRRIKVEKQDEGQPPSYDLVMKRMIEDDLIFWTEEEEEEEDVDDEMNKDIEEEEEEEEEEKTLDVSTAQIEQSSIIETDLDTFNSNTSPNNTLLVPIIPSSSIEQVSRNDRVDELLFELQFPPIPLPRVAPKTKDENGKTFAQ